MDELPQAILNEGLRDIWYQRDAQKAWEYVRSKVTTDEMSDALNRRKAQGLSTESPNLREEAASARVINSNGSDRVVTNFHNAIRAAFKQRFGFSMPMTARPQLNEALAQFLGSRDGLQKIPISNRALIPRAAVSLGKWGEMRLSQVLNGTGTKPSKAFKSSLSYRFPDRMFNRIAHESKGGLNVKLTSKIRAQILKDSDLIRRRKFKAVHWHFFQGAQPDVLNFLEQNGIGYTIY